MLLQRFTNYILRHRYQALALTFFSTFVPVVGVIGILIAAFMTLLKGAVEGLLFALAATLPYVISFYVTGKQDATMPLMLWAAVGVAVLSNILTWVFAVMLRRQSSWSTIIQIAALLGALVVTLIHVAYPGVADWWGVKLQDYYSQMVTVASSVKAKASASDALEAINTNKQFATGVMVSAILFNAMMQLIIARWWQAILYSPGSLRRGLQNIRLNHTAGGLFLLSVVLAYLGNGIILDIMPILYVLFGVAGLSLIHYFFSSMATSSRWFWLTVLYMALIFSLPMSAIFVAALAWFDIWFDLRKRLQKA